MQLTLLDWLAIGLYFAANIGIGLYYRSRATSSTEEFFVGGRNVSWWLAVTSMVSSLSGLWGVLIMDLFQFALKMGMVIVLAVYSVKAVGGMDQLKEKLLALDSARAAGGGHGSILSFVPDIGSAWMPMITFFVYIAVNWWATWYPGAEPGGGGYVAQRMFCARDEKHSLLATLWFNIAHYAIRPWPWVLVALASIILYP